MSESPTGASPGANRQRLLELLLRQRGLGTPKASPAAYAATHDGERPVSLAQQRLWVLDQIIPGHPLYNAPIAYRLRGEIDVDALHKTLNYLVARHESLRTTFLAKPDGPVQVVDDPYSVELPVTDLSGLPTDAAEAEALRRAREDAALSFDLERGPLMRVSLLRLSADDHVLLLCLHHIITDGWSLGVLFRELGTCYRAFRDGGLPALPESELQYTDFALRQLAELTGPRMREQRAYWLDKLAGSPSLLTFPTDRSRPAEPTFAGTLHSFTVPPEIVSQLRELAERHDATLFMVLLTAFKILLARFSGESDIVVGSPIANRNRSELEAIVGFFVNTLVLRTDLSGDLDFVAALRRVRETALGAYDHQDMPFEKLVAELQPDRQLSVQPLFQTSFQLYQPQNVDVDAGHSTVVDELLTLDGLSTELLDARAVTSKFDLSLLMLESGTDLVGRIEYSTELYDEPTMASLCDSFATLLESIAADAGQPIGELSILSARQREQVLTRWNDTARQMPSGATLPELLAEQVTASPDAIALVAGPDRMSYRDLDMQANQLAHRLHEMGVGPGARVGLCLQRSIPMVVGLLAALKAGAAYVPLDPAYPAHRLEFLADDAGVEVVLTVRSLADKLPGRRKVRLDQDDHGGYPTSSLETAVGPDDPAYVIHTSGSTGRPKGVVVRHSSAVNYVTWARDTYCGGEPRAFALFTSLSFDLTLTSVFVPLVSGGSVVVYEGDDSLAEPEVVRVFRDDNVDVVKLTPTHLGIVRDLGLSPKRLRVLVVGGEDFKRGLAADVDELLGHRAAIYNEYGPTEATVGCVLYRFDSAVDRAASVPIGHPAPNTRVYVLDEDGRPVPPSVRGELYISGTQVAAGYINRPELTDRGFVVDPYSDGPDRARMYRTGDAARWRADGVIEYLGRLDDQVKIRGFRIEPGEVESSLIEHPLVRQAVVLAGLSDGNAKLVAYVVPEEPDDGSVAEEQTTNWCGVFDHLYADSSPSGAAKINFAGWVSSYTGEPIADEQMLEWVKASVDRVAALDPERVLELGCGTGLLLLRIAPQVAAYVGLDISREAIESLRDVARRDEALRHVELRVQAADDFSGLDGAQFDTVVINSVAQYFPDAGYLTGVLSGALAHLVPGGAVYLGDLRCLSLQDTENTSIELFRSDPDARAAEVRRRVQRRSANENELLIDPEFFAQLPAVLPDVATVDIRLRRGSGTEMARFRYDVVLRKAPARPLVYPANWLDWDDAGLDLSALLEGRSTLAVRGIPNARAAGAAVALDLLQTGDSSATAEHLLAVAMAEPGVDPEELHRLACGLGYEVATTWSRGRADGRFDAVFYRPGHPTPAVTAPMEPGLLPLPAAQLANDPLRGRRSRAISEVLHTHLTALLPDHLVPSSFVVLNEFPVTPHGKLDRTALPEFHAPVLLDTNSDVAPLTHQEETLVRIWCEVLQLERVGVHDNFFSVGGDSIQGIQMVTMAGNAGLRLTPKLIFQYPTIAELAAVANTVVTVAPEQGLLVGSVPLLPIQRWLLDNGSPLTQPFTQFAEIDLAPGTDLDLLELALGAVVNHHDALRLRFEHGADGWHQHVGPSLERLPCMRVTEFTDEIHSGIDLEHGPVVRAAATARKLLLTAHHLVVDWVSWSILLADMDTAYGQLTTGERVALPAKTSSVKQWAERITATAGSLDVEYWSRVVREGTPMPVDGVNVPGTYGTARTASYHLDESETDALLNEVSGAYRTQVTDVLLCALARAYTRWSGQSDMVVDVEGHGRDLADDVDVGRTVGWFTTLYPVRLIGDENLRTALMAAKETLRGVPDGGLGYGVLRHISGDLPASPAELRFNYLGRIDESRARFGSWVSPERPRSHLLEVDAVVVAGRFEATWRWYPAAHHDRTVDSFARMFLESLREVIAHCSTVRTVVHTPSDFPLAELSQETIDEHFADPVIQDVYPLTPVQEGIVFAALTADEPGMYVEQVVWTMPSFDPEAFDAAWQQAAGRHSALRTRIEFDADEQPLQVVLGSATVAIDRGDGGQDLDELLRRDRERAIDLTSAPLLRLTVLDMSDAAARVLLTCHHVMLDGWSVSLLLSEVLEEYAALRAGGRVSHRRPRPFRDFVARLLGSDHTNDELFWREYLGGVSPSALALPAPEQATTGFNAFDQRMSAEFGSQLARFASEIRVTPNAVVTGAWGLVLSRYLCREDVVCATTASGRDTLPAMEGMVGMFVNTVPARMRVQGSARVGEWLRSVQREHGRRPEQTPLTLVHTASGLPHDVALFESLITVENYPMEAAVRDTLTGPDGTIHAVDRNGFPLTLAADLGAAPLFRLLFDRSLFAEPAVRRMLGRVITVITEMMVDPDRTLAEISLSDRPERTATLAAVTGASVAPAGLVHERIAAQAAATPDHPAVACGETSWTYRELDDMVGRLAHRLHGVAPEETVAVCLPPGPELLVALLAVLRSGGTYLPLDPSQPVERLRRLAADAGVRLGVTRPDVRPDIEVRWVDPDAPPMHRADEPRHDVPATPGMLAYLLYTSGSTGQPKGVAVTHAAAAAHLEMMVGTLELNGEDRVLALSPATFDISLEQMLVPLLAGATVVFCDGEPWNPRDFLEQATRYGVTVANLAAPYWHQIVEELQLGLPLPAGQSIRMLLLGASAVSREMVPLWRQHVPGVRILCGYGLTEAVITTTLYEIPEEMPRRLPVGAVLPNRTLYVVDTHGGLAPPDVPGEIHLGGASLARCYPGNPAETADRFVPDWLGGGAGARLYRTGDMGMLRPDGSVVVLGRKDDQIKVRGLRVEPREIESALTEHPDVVQAAVLLADDGDRLVGFVVSGTEGLHSSPGLREFARARLPVQLIPDLLVPIDTMPLTRHGKLDVAALVRLIPGVVEDEADQVQPSGWLEELVAQCWGEVLGVERVSARDNFFDLGGHSLRASRVASRLRRALATDIPLRLVLERPQLDEFCAELGGLMAASASDEEFDQLLAEMNALPDA